jgi:uncharacterized protein YecT (DUF1311 family)
MRLIVAAILLFMLNLNQQAKAQEIQAPQCQEGLDTVPLILCMDDDVREFEDLKNFVMDRILARIELKYAKNDPARAKTLKEKVENYSKSWDGYRLSYCDLESIHITDEDNRSQFVKDCLMSLTKSRIEELRLLQINI